MGMMIVHACATSCQNILSPLLPHGPHVRGKVSIVDLLLTVVVTTALCPRGASSVEIAYVGRLGHRPREGKLSFAHVQQRGLFVMPTEFGELAGLICARESFGE
jgi:hypothetical protein